MRRGRQKTYTEKTKSKGVPGSMKLNRPLQIQRQRRGGILRSLLRAQDDVKDVGWLERSAGSVLVVVFVVGIVFGLFVFFADLFPAFF